MNPAELHLNAAASVQLLGATALLGVSLSLVFGGYALVKWADKKPKSG
jgi:hypothetical protein